MVSSSCKMHRSFVLAAFAVSDLYKIPIERLSLRKWHDTYTKFEIYGATPEQNVAIGSDTWTVGKILDPLWVEHIGIRRWLNTCARQHGSRCQSPLSSILPSPRPLWFIDTWQQRIVKADASQSYIALSYVWGN
jgi:hypothetical protein